MRAWRVLRTGTPTEALALGSVPVPTPGEDEVLVRVRAACLGFPDVLLASGEYQTKPELPFVPGVELCGEVVTDRPGLPAGTRVMGIARIPNGALAEYAVSETRKLWHVPERLNDAEASAFTTSYQTAWLALHHRGRLQRGETLLVHAAAGGVGSAAVMLGRIAGAHVVAVVGGAHKADVARTLGADAVVDRHRHSTLEEMVTALRKTLPNGRADVVFDPVGGDAFHASVKVLAPDGRLAVIGFAGGDIPTLSVNRALLKNIDVAGVFWGGYVNTSPHVIDIVTRALDELVQQQDLRPYVSEVVRFEGAPDALERLRGGASTGRLVVSIGQQA